MPKFEQILKEFITSKFVPKQKPAVRGGRRLSLYIYILVITNIQI